MKEIEFVFTY